MSPGIGLAKGADVRGDHDGEQWSSKMTHAKLRLLPAQMQMRGVFQPRPP